MTRRTPSRIGPKNPPTWIDTEARPTPTRLDSPTTWALHENHALIRFTSVPSEVPVVDLRYR
jgi:hypothetical protein